MIFIVKVLTTRTLTNGQPLLKHLLCNQQTLSFIIAFLRLITLSITLITLITILFLFILLCIFKEVIILLE
jgi:hypothetical protein